MNDRLQLPTLPAYPAECNRWQGTLLNVATGELRDTFCKAWTCEACGPRKVRQWVLRIKNEQYAWFLTLTLDGAASAENPETFRRLAHVWRNVWWWLKRHYSLSGYTWVREQGERSTRRVHLHVLLRCKRIPARKLRAVVRRAGGGLWLHLSRVRKAHAARKYVSKYLTKTLGKNVWPRYVRRIQSTAARVRPDGMWIMLLKRKHPPKRRTWWQDAKPLQPVSPIAAHDWLCVDERVSEGPASPVERSSPPRVVPVASHGSADPSADVRADEVSHVERMAECADWFVCGCGACDAAREASEPILD